MSKPKIVQKHPYVMDMKAGKYAYCTCGESSKDPFCDGSHSGSDFKPEIVVLDEDVKVPWCGCKHSSKGAICDGSHARV
ncbi:MAG: CDGSH iron-sulfur domain-containing protein [Flavobacteriales bacterium]|nr:CDGSH iron-sulfur domain-containing protein [Flavobacteriales bacterium]